MTPDQVRAVLTETGDADLAPFIDVATRMLDRVFAAGQLADQHLADLELYVSAHLAAVTLEKGGLTRTKVGESEDWFAHAAHSDAMGLEATPYGKTAMLLDTTGLLRQQAARSFVFQVA